MHIAFLQNLYQPNLKVQKNVFDSYLNQEKHSLDCDKISFTSIKVFKNKTKAFDYYSKIADEANLYLKKNDVSNALRVLGYNTAVNPSNGKIKVIGNYNHRFDYIIENENILGGKRKSYFPYRDMGINTSQIAQNICSITGATDEYKSFDRALTHRADLVNGALEFRDYKKALTLLGYKISEDKDGNITINGDYSSDMLTIGKRTKTFSDYNINESHLLTRVTRINGNANFGVDFHPVKYIDISGRIFQNDTFTSDLSINQVNQELEKQFLLLKPETNHKIDEANRLLRKKDSFSALNILNINCSRNADGKITINQDFDFSYSSPQEVKLSFREMGINFENIFNNVQKIKGDLSFVDSSITDLSGIEVEGVIHPFSKTHEERLFNGYYSLEDISAICNGVKTDILETFIKKGKIKPQYKTDSNCYFKNIDGENKQFLDYISANRDKILTFDEVREKFNVGSLFLERAVNKGSIKPFGVDYRDGDDIHTYMFDISDKSNYRCISSYSQSKTKASKSPDINNSYQMYVREDNPYLKYKDIDRKNVPISVLEHLGYGTKPDLMEACMLMTNFYPLQKFILNHDTFDITQPTMQTILLTSRKNNPAIITLSELRKQLGENYEEVNEAILAGKMDIMAINFYRKLSVRDYCVDLFNEKNYEYLKNVDNPEFQEFLAEKLNAYNERKERNEAYLEEFKKMPPLTPHEQERIVQKRILEIQAKQKELLAQRKLLLKQQREERIRDVSLRMAIAWALCPQTLAIKRELSNPYVNEIFERNRVALEISQELLTGVIDQEEAECRLSKLNLSKKEQAAVLSYNKSCWKVAGTEEWSRALVDATPLVKIYKQYGLDGIQDERVRQRIIEWQYDHN